MKKIKLSCMLILFALTISLSAQTKNKDVLLFEIEKFSSPGGGGMGNRLNSTNTFYFYQSGRITCKSLRYDPRGKEIRGNKSKCLQISKAKINELTELAEQSDFQTESYQYFNGGADWGKSMTITYFKKGGNKEIRLTPPRRTVYSGIIPVSLNRFLSKLGEISKTLKVEDELRKRTFLPV